MDDMEVIPQNFGINDAGRLMRYDIGVERWVRLGYSLDVGEKRGRVRISW
jgi:hypothetical protein